MEACTPQNFKNPAENIELTEQLPEEIWSKIFRFSDWTPTSLVCQEWYGLMEHRFREMCINMKKTYVCEEIGYHESDLPIKEESEDYYHYAYRLHDKIEQKLYFVYKKNPKTSSIFTIEKQISDQWSRDAQVFTLS